MLMRYWGRKPIELIDELLTEVTDSTVIDPFGGAGSIVLSALRHGNRAIYLDINPYAWLVAFVNIVSIDAEEFKRKSEEVLNNLVIIRKRTLKSDFLYYSNGKPFWKKRSVDRVSQFFTTDNFRKLYSILKSIDNVNASPEVKIALYGAFCSSLFKASKMKRENAGSWGVPSYWIPESHKEIDAIEAFKSEVKRFFSYFKSHKGYKIGEEVKMQIGSSLSFNYNKNHILFTDPPFFDEVQYMELSFFYWVWLRESKFRNVARYFLGKNITFRISYEMIVNPNKGINYDKYLEMLDKFLLRTKRIKRKYLLFHYDKKDFMRRVISLTRERWKEVKIENFEIENQRNIGPRGGKKYVLIYS
ncbi:DNA adenine methylase [Sulfurisphaera ohwakuensis]|uniref:16S rRNA G966 N2-methylase RsmD n=1 Tax=Sulfurisphaera ohwakuensis TaxID=69656 RepID=A0A650CF91_SULOH|nr:DNA adenine methylase [Sulfurisphaera ohwakuensis]MBB5254129.1 16S rRNA G966 N2-methylase RsmD [Sulfurisphaera ohwakuensis]QGR16510.1 DNA methyltransferase [Sulfurisphaera ohwakuensis]